MLLELDPSNLVPPLGPRVLEYANRQFPPQAVLHEVHAVMQERVQVEGAAAIAWQEHAPPAPEITTVGPILS